MSAGAQRVRHVADGLSKMQSPWFISRTLPNHVRSNLGTSHTLPQGSPGGEIAACGDVFCPPFYGFTISTT